MGADRIFRRFRDLLDVTFGSPGDGDVVQFDAGTDRLVLAPPTGGGGASALIDLTDVTGTAGTGKAPVSDGAAHFALTDVATQAELDSEASTRASAISALSSVYQPLDSDLTAIAALSTTSFGRNLLALADAAAGRTALGLGTAAVAATGDFDAAGAAAAAQAASQPLDSDLTAIAALTTTSFGRAFLALADAAASRTALGLVIGTDVQAHDSDLDTYAGITPSANVQSVLGAANYSAIRTLLGLVVGTDVQAHDADLDTYASITPSANIQSLLGAANYAAIRTLLGLVVGTDVQAHDSDLDALSALTTAAYGRSLLELTNLAGLYTTLGVDTDGTLAANSDTKIPSQKAVKTYADQLIASADAMVFKGVTDCSANPNYPAGNRGDTYRVSVAGKIGGASGTVVEVGDLFICLDDGTSAGTQAAQGAHWSVAQTNIDGAVTGPTSATSGDFATFSGVSGKVVQDSGVALDTDTALAANSDSKIASQKATKAYADGKYAKLAPTAVKTVNYSASGGDFVPVDTTSGGVTVTFPTAPVDGTLVAIKHVTQGGANTVGLALGGSDVFNKAGGATTGTLTLLNQAIICQYKASGAIWYVLADDLPLSVLDSRYVSSAAGSVTSTNILDATITRADISPAALAPDNLYLLRRICKR